MSNNDGDEKSRIELAEDDEPDLTEVTASALVAARKAFEAYLDSRNLDGAYWSIKFTAWLLDETFKHKLEKIEIENEPFNNTK